MILKPEELQTCNSCGFCQAACPVYRITRHEGSSARGHQVHLKAMLNDAAEPDEKITSHIGECLTCRACTANCPPGVKTDRFIVEARSRMTKSKAEGTIYRKLLANPGRMRQGMKALGIANAPLALLQKLPVSQDFIERAASMLPRPQGGFLLERLERIGLNYTSSVKDVTYFMSCGMNYLTPAAGEATLSFLKRSGYRVTVSENVCCGLPAYIGGDVDAARQLAKKNLELLAKTKGLILTDCASCSSFLKEYVELVGEEAAEVVARVRDFTEFSLTGQLALTDNVTAKQIVTYHDPCHLSRYQKLRNEPRQIIKSIPGVEFRELPEADWCCGGAGSYGLKHPKLSNKILERKMENVRRTGAKVLATACPGCILQLNYGVKKFNVPVEVVHISELLAEGTLEKNM